MYELTDETIEKYGRTLYRVINGDDKLGWCEDLDSIKSDKVTLEGQDFYIFKHARLHSGVFHSGEFWGGVFHSGEFWGGVFGGGVFRGGVFHSGEFWGGVFHSGEFWGGEFWGGVFGGGEFRGGVFWGGVFWGGVIKSSDDFMSISPIGSEGGVFTIYKTENGFEVTRGCFKGSASEFIDAVEKTHGDNEYAKQYNAVIELCKIKFGEVL